MTAAARRALHVRSLMSIRRPVDVMPSRIVPDAYPSLRLIADLRAPLLVLHDEDDAIVPVEHGKALFAAAPEPKRLRLMPGVGHNDIVSRTGNVVAAEVASWASTTTSQRRL